MRVFVICDIRYVWIDNQQNPFSKYDDSISFLQFCLQFIDKRTKKNESSNKKQKNNAFWMFLLTLTSRCLYGYKYITVFVFYKKKNKRMLCREQSCPMFFPIGLFFLLKYPFHGWWQKFWCIVVCGLLRFKVNDWHKAATHKEKNKNDSIMAMMMKNLHLDVDVAINYVEKCVSMFDK